MTDETPWSASGADSDSFIYAMFGARAALQRLNDDTYSRSTTAVEAAWWLSAAVTACGRKNGHDVLQGIWWIRNQGSHHTYKAFGVVELAAYGGQEDPDGHPEPDMWLPIPQDEPVMAGGAAEAYQVHVADRPLNEPLEAAYAELQLILAFALKGLD